MFFKLLYLNLQYFFEKYKYTGYITRVFSDNIDCFLFKKLPMFVSVFYDICGHIIRT